jgi:hypothetical protein
VSGEGEELALLRSANLDWVHALVERLEQAEIPCHVASVGEKCARNGSWAVYVRPADVARALEVDAAVLREVVPDLPEGFDPVNVDTGRCPACQEPVLESASECASCGLALL